MNVIQLCGGLGNQLFQYAFGRAQMENGIDVEYNVGWYGKFGKERFYRLDKFCVDVKINPSIGQKFFTKKDPDTNRRNFKEKGFDLSLLERDNCNFGGYWQYLGYYKNILPILKEEFRVREEFYTADYLTLRKQIIKDSSISIHVRRGDYLELKDFPVALLNYYFEALKYVKGALYIFSDDLQWCKENFKPDYFSRKITFVDLEDYLDFELMRLCKHNIIASSSFSWWAAYLNNNPEKIVITPKQWFKDRKDLCPENWIRL